MHFVVPVIRHRDTFISNISHAGREWARILSVKWLGAWRPILVYQQDSLSNHIQIGPGGTLCLLSDGHLKILPWMQSGRSKNLTTCLNPVRCYKRIQPRYSTIRSIEILTIPKGSSFPSQSTTANARARWRCLLTQSRQPAIPVVCYFATFKIKISGIMGPKWKAKQILKLSSLTDE
jgi:hypothetical protein